MIMRIKIRICRIHWIRWIRHIRRIRVRICRIRVLKIARNLVVNIHQLALVAQIRSKVESVMNLELFIAKKFFIWKLFVCSFQEKSDYLTTANTCWWCQQFLVEFWPNLTPKNDFIWSHNDTTLSWLSRKKAWYHDIMKLSKVSKDIVIIQNNHKFYKCLFKTLSNLYGGGFCGSSFRLSLKLQIEFMHIAFCYFNIKFDFSEYVSISDVRH